MYCIGGSTPHLQVKTPVPRSELDHKKIEALRKATFELLQPICSRLFIYGTDQARISKQLAMLEQVITSSKVEGLQECLDYVLFPLQLSLDAIYAFYQTKGDEEVPQHSESSSFAQLSALSSLKVAETALLVLLSLMERCCCRRLPQLMALLQRVSSLLTLPRDNVSEEFQLTTLRLVTALFQREHGDGAIRELSHSDDASAPMGHLLSLLVKYPGQERKRGQQASKEIQQEAMRALRSIIQVIDNVESLSFFLPGLVIGLSRELLVANHVKSSQGTVMETLETLRILLVKTLADKTLSNVLNLDSNKKLQQQVDDDVVKAGITPEIALLHLEALKVRVKQTSESEFSPSLMSQPPSTSIETNIRATQRDTTNTSESTPRFRVDRTADWVQETAQRIEQTLDVALPPLLDDSRPTIRVNLVKFCSTVLSECCHSLPNCRKLLLDCILSLAQDEWPQVNQAAKLWLKHVLKTKLVLGSVIQSSMETAFVDWIETLAASLRKSQAAGRLQALKLTTCLECMSPALIADLIFQNSAFTNKVIGSFVNSFAVDHESASLLLMMPPEMSNVHALELGEELPSKHDSRSPLPRIPLYLKIITTERCYRAVSGPLRALAGVAVDAGEQTPGAPDEFVHGLLNASLHSLQSLIEKADFSRRRSKHLKLGSKKGRQYAIPVASGIEFDDDHLVPWTAQAAQLIAVVSEILYGIRLNQLSKGKDDLEFMDSLLHATLLSIIDERIWELATSKSKGTFSRPQVQSGLIDENTTVGCNILLMRTVLDCVGVIGICMGERFCGSGRFTRISLLPVAEKLDDASAIVSSAAFLALHCMSIGCAAPDGNRLRQLFYLNSDYIVDGLCRQLRQPELYPRAPNLFSAILKQNGIASGLLPLLAEPARHALLGTSILSRHRNPQHVLSFVYCLREIAKGAEVLAREVLDALHARKRDLQQRLANSKMQKPSETLDRVVDSDSLHDDGVDIAKIERDFDLHNQGQPVGSGVDSNDAGASQIRKDLQEQWSSRERLKVSMDEWNDYQVLKQQAGSCARLGQSISDSIGPLAASSNLDIAVQALISSIQALEALSKAHSALELCKNDIEPCMELPPAAVAAVPGDKESSAKTLLPSVHLLWGPLMGALGDWRIAVVENALVSMEKLAQLAGQFLARRFSQDAWAVMVRLLKEGPSQQRVLAPGQDELFSPMILQRARLAVIQCVRNLASCDSKNGIAVILPLVTEAMVAVSNFMDDAQVAPIREEATKCFMCLASLDSDVAWALLASTIKKHRPKTPTMSNKQVYAFKPVKDTINLKVSGLYKCSKSKLEALLSKVEELPVLWHVLVQQQLDAFS
jgi:hypothetical protein